MEYKKLRRRYNNQKEHIFYRLLLFQATREAKKNEKISADDKIDKKKNVLVLSVY